MEVRIGEVADINPTFKSATILPNELVDFLPMAAVEEGNSVARATEYRPLADVQKGYTNFNDGDVLLAKITPCFENGKIAQVRLKHRCGFGSTEFHVLRPHDDKLDGRYLVHFLRRDEIRIDGERKMTGSAGQRRVPKHFLESLPIYLPALPEQRRIAAILDQADALRAKRREALEQLDELQHAIFIEMFGDPVTNPKGWPVTNLGSFLLDVTNGLTRRGGEADAGEDIVLRLRDIRAGSIDFSDPNRITLNDKERAKYQVALGELLFIRVNGNPDYVGRCALFDGHAEKIYFNDHVMRVRLKDGLIGGYLSHLLNRPEGKREISKHRKTSAGQHTINQAGLAAILLPIPDETLQRQFVDRLDTLHKWRVVHTNAQAELDALFGSLQHRAFRGEL